MIKRFYKVLKSTVAQFVEQTLKTLCEWKDIEILELNIKEDYIHMILSIPSRLQISQSHGNIRKEDSDKTLKKFSHSQEEPLFVETTFGVGDTVLVQ